MSNNSIKSIDRTQSGVTTPDQREPGSDGNEEVLRIPQSSRIARASPWDFLVSYSWQSSFGGGSYPSAKTQLVCSKAPAAWQGKEENKNLKKKVVKMYLEEEKEKQK